MNKLNVPVRFFILIRQCFTSVFNAIAVYKKSPYCIEEINMESQMIVLRLRGTGAVIKMALESAVNNNQIIEGLSSIQASLLGGCFGRILGDIFEKSVALRKVRKDSFVLKDEPVAQYKIIYQNRDGSIGYIDKKKREEFLEHPLTIVNAGHVIRNFNSSQACYIGILAGISMERAIMQDEKMGKDQVNVLLRKTPILRIVK